MHGKRSLLPSQESLRNSLCRAGTGCGSKLRFGHPPPRLGSQTPRISSGRREVNKLVLGFLLHLHLHPSTSTPSQSTGYESRTHCLSIFYKMGTTFDHSFSSSTIRPNHSRATVPTMAESLPSIDFGFDDLRERMAKFTRRFDDFIAEGRKRVLEERNQFRMNIAERQGQTPNPPVWMRS